MPEATYAGVPRSKIPWYPIIDYDKCDKCERCSGEELECVKFCAHGVFKTVENQGKRKPIVIKPDACVVFCTSCGKACPTDAITFPPKKEVRDMIEKLRNGDA